MLRLFACLLLFCVILSGCNTQSHESIVVPAVTAANPANQSVSMPRQLTALDQQICSYLESVWNRDKKTPSRDVVVANGLIEASKEFNKPVTEIYRTYLLVLNNSARVRIPDQEIEDRIVPDLVDMGFKNVGARWFFKNKAVDFGYISPEINLKQVSKPQKIDVLFDVEVEVSDLHYIKIKGSTNLPDNINLILKTTGSKFSASHQATVMNGKFESNWISDVNQAGSRMASGKYTVEVSSAISEVQDADAKLTIGPLGRRLSGGCIKFSPGTGNRIVYIKNFTV